MTNTVFHMQQLCAHRPVKMEAIVQDLVFVSAHQAGLETDVKPVIVMIIIAIIKIITKYIFILNLAMVQFCCITGMKKIDYHKTKSYTRKNWMEFKMFTNILTVSLIHLHLSMNVIDDVIV